MEQSREGPKFPLSLQVCATLPEVGAVTLSVGDYLDVLVLLSQGVVGQDLVDGDTFGVCPRVP